MSKENEPVADSEIFVNFYLSIEEANKIIAALGTQPFNTVASLINKMIDQAKDQLPNLVVHQAPPKDNVGQDVPVPFEEDVQDEANVPKPTRTRAK